MKSGKNSFFLGKLNDNQRNYFNVAIYIRGQKFNHHQIFIFFLYLSLKLEATAFCWHWSQPKFSYQCNYLPKCNELPNKYMHKWLVTIRLMYFEAGKGFCEQVGHRPYLISLQSADSKSNSSIYSTSRNTHKKGKIIIYKG